MMESQEEAWAAATVVEKEDMASGRRGWCAERAEIVYAGASGGVPVRFFGESSSGARCRL